MSWSFSNDKPIFQQLVDIITLKIISGEYPTGSKLDTVRELAVAWGVPEGKVKMSLLRTREKLKKYLIQKEIII